MRSFVHHVRQKTACFAGVSDLGMLLQGRGCRFDPGRLHILTSNAVTIHVEIVTIQLRPGPSGGRIRRMNEPESEDPIHVPYEPLSVRWLKGQIARGEALAVESRRLTYHFSAEGSDETGDGSRENPWRSQAKAQDILDTRGDVAILFRRGYVLTDPLTIRHENVTVGSYGEHRDA